MTKEELKQEAEEKCVCTDEAMRIMYRIGYIDGAEPREKRIAELEATCNKWFEHFKNREEELLNELNNQNAKYNKQIADLEKENAELKAQCSILADCNTCTSACKTENIEMKTQLTKAKDLLAKWVELFKPKLEGYPITLIQEQTEQFLNSEVEKCGQ